MGDPIYLVQMSHSIQGLPMGHPTFMGHPTYLCGTSHLTWVLPIGLTLTWDVTHRSSQSIVDTTYELIHYIEQVYIHKWGNARRSMQEQTKYIQIVVNYYKVYG